MRIDLRRLFWELLELGIGRRSVRMKVPSAVIYLSNLGRANDLTLAVSSLDLRQLGGIARLDPFARYEPIV